MNLQSAIDWQSKSKLFVSLAAKPGKTGETFYKTLFNHHSIDAEYVACVCTDLAHDMQLVRRHCAGASITMPFKRTAAHFVDTTVSPVVGAITPINTVVNRNGILTAYNCDYLGLADVAAQDFKGLHVVILGDGAMSENARLLCKDATITQASRRSNTWQLRNTQCDVLINTTSVGMNSADSPVDYINANTVIDCVIGDTELLRKANPIGAKTISGAEIYKAQFKYQFKCYTNQEPDSAVVAAVAKQLFNYV
jgi:shikimate dehydrogenase